MGEWIHGWDEDRLAREHRHAQRAKDLNKTAHEWAELVQAEVLRRKQLQKEDASE